MVHLAIRIVFLFHCIVFFAHCIAYKKRTENAKVKSQNLMFLLLHFQRVVYVNT